jgi:hypothetical protein
MIAVLGIKMYEAGNVTKIEKSEIHPHERTDDIIVNWK